jgi:chemotaxis protein methyltransferase WspC
MQQIEHRLRQVMGLDAASIGHASLQRTIRLRMKAAGAASLEDYERLLNSSATEWNHLVEDVVITETWFFRDRQAFSALASLCAAEWLPKHPAATCRILSLPCSSGEEPYSIVMALLDAGLPAARFAVHGVDLSARALERARAGLYGRNSFRGEDLAFRDRHFKPEGAEFLIRQGVRDGVTFQHANLLGDDFSTAGAAYDFIFCRNLLIYFDRETQRRAFSRLKRMLAPGGTLFVGPAEAPLALENGFATLGLPMAFACRRTAADAGKKHPAGPSRVARSPHPQTAGLPPPTPVLKPEPPQVHPPEVPLETARALADSGKLDEAVLLCHAHLGRHGASSQAFYLLGVIHDAQGRPDAREFYRKALYLDPNHYESLLQMALHAEKDGDEAAARNLRRRAQRQQGLA